jgi:hypothetical protein
VFIADSTEGDHWRIFRHDRDDCHFMVSTDEKGVLVGKYV